MSWVKPLALRFPGRTNYRLLNYASPRHVVLFTEFGRRIAVSRFAGVLW